MIVRLLRYKNSKIDAVKCLRDVMTSDPGLRIAKETGLRIAKEICEGLPFDASVNAGRMMDLQRQFEIAFEDVDDARADLLLATWTGLPRDQQVLLLHHLETTGYLRLP